MNNLPKKYPFFFFLELKRSLPYLHQPATDPDESNQSSHHISVRSILILSSYLRRTSPKYFLKTKFSEFIICYMRATCPAYLILLYLICSLIFMKIRKWQ
jgi:hypothetical protein